MQELKTSASDSRLTTGEPVQTRKLGEYLQALRLQDMGGLASSAIFQSWLSAAIIDYAYRPPMVVRGVIKKSSKLLI